MITQKFLDSKIQFLDHYLTATNASNGSKFDANANVSQKNVATLASEMNKDVNIAVNRELMKRTLTSLFGKDTADEYARQLKNHIIYKHDETASPGIPYCTSISMYPFLLDGLVKMGGDSEAPKHISSFCGSFVNLVFAISSQFAGAVATVEFLMYFDYFARKDYGDDYMNTHKKEVENHLQHVVYALNQPAAARGYQSVFWNISLYDKEYFQSMFGDFRYPDFTAPSWESLKKFQEFFMTWFNEERTRKVLTFPVVTAAMLVDNEKPKDEEFARMCAKQLSEGNSFFIYQSDSPDSLASCCRLRNEIVDNTFSYSLGAGGVSTGSISVMTLNMNRFIQQNKDNLHEALAKQIDDMHKFQVAFRHIIQQFKDNGLLTVYDAGFISLEKQFLTIGINGLLEGAEYLGYTAGNNAEYKEFVSGVLKVIFDKNKEAKEKYGYMFNTEFVPGENLGKKHAKWDYEDGLEVPRPIYNSYFYPVEDENISVIDKFILHGREINKFLDGGSALHLNLEQYLDAEQFYQLMCISAKTGCNYFCTNVKVTICNVCNNIDKRTLKVCPSCGSEDVDYATRIIGYLKRISSWTDARQEEEGRRLYHLRHF